MKILYWLRSLFGAVTFVFVTFFLSASAILFSFVTTSQRIPRLHIKWWGISTCWLFGVKVIVHGKELWKRNSGGVVLFNHTSFFDIFTMVGFLPDMRFGAKIELFRIPVFGAAMKRVGILPIDRKKRDKVFEIYNQALDRLSAGEKIALAPEGKRTSSPHQLAHFKSGPFVFALQSQVDLIPVVIKGAYEILPKGQMLPNVDRLSAKVHLFVLSPVPTDSIVQEKRIDLQNLVRNQMQAVLNEKQDFL